MDDFTFVRQVHNLERIYAEKRREFWRMKKEQDRVPLVQHNAMQIDADGRGRIWL